MIEILILAAASARHRRAHSITAEVPTLRQGLVLLGVLLAALVVAFLLGG